VRISMTQSGQVSNLVVNGRLPAREDEENHLDGE
jgi:hypothetical protein